MDLDGFPAVPWDVFNKASFKNLMFFPRKLLPFCIGRLTSKIIEVKHCDILSDAFPPMLMFPLGFPTEIGMRRPQFSSIHWYFWDMFRLAPWVSHGIFPRKKFDQDSHVCNSHCVGVVRLTKSIWIMWINGKGAKKQQKSLVPSMQTKIIFKKELLVAKPRKAIKGSQKIAIQHAIPSNTQTKMC